jgi:K(+)-stimulated pyrophosphate-energized sodium pump
MENTWPYITLVLGILGLGVAGFYAWWVLRQDPGDELMQKISRHVQEGASAFLKREYSTAIGFLLLVALAMFFFIKSGGQPIGRFEAFAYLFGVICSGSIGVIGMYVSTRANCRTTQAAKTGMGPALRLAFRGGSVTGLAVVGIGLFGVSLVYIVINILWKPTTIVSPTGLYNFTPDVIAAFGLGASSIALFARVGGGIFTKAADVGADLVGKVEAGIPEDDPRNPAVIADNVGDNVGDVAGMGADLYESYVGSIVAPVALGAILFAAVAPSQEWKGMILPLAIAGVGIICSILASFLVRSKASSHPGRALSVATYGSAILTMIASYFLVTQFLKNTEGIKNPVGFFISIVAGLAAGMLIGQISEIYTSDRFRTVKNIAKSSETGAATNILAGIAAGMQSTAGSILLLVAAIAAAFLAGRWAITGVWSMSAGVSVGNGITGGIYGIALAAIGMLSTTGTVVAVDAYGPIADNAGGISEMSHQPPEVREITDSLDSAGNTTAAIAKGFAIASAGVTALALFRAFTDAVGIDSAVGVDLTRYTTIIGLFLGAAFPFLFSSLAINAVGKAANKMVEEVRRQFREIPGLLEGKEGVEAEYSKCVDISTKAALRYMIVPASLAVASPIVIGLWNVDALAGYLAGSLVVGFLMAIFMANAGGAWDNAKKYIEAGNLGGKGTATHAAAVVGDTVGDPFKDTAGPCMNIMIKVMTVIALVFAPIFIK